ALPILQAVVNYVILTDSEVYVHRIGRTGHAGKSGLAVTLVAENEMFRLEQLGHFLDQAFEAQDGAALPPVNKAPQKPPMVTLSLDGGRKNKIRPGDIVGALTGEAGIDNTHIGKIDVFDFVAYVAITRKVASEALEQLQNGKIKGRKIRVRRV